MIAKIFMLINIFKITEVIINESNLNKTYNSHITQLIKYVKYTKKKNGHGF